METELEEMPAIRTRSKSRDHQPSNKQAEILQAS